MYFCLKIINFFFYINNDKTCREVMIVYGASLYLIYKQTSSIKMSFFFFLIRKVDKNN